MNKIIFSIFLVLGLCLLVQYYLLMQQDYKTIDKFWSNNGANKLNNQKNSKKIYAISIIISAIAGLFLFYYLSFEIDNIDEVMTNAITIAIMCAIGFSLMWIPLFFLGNKDMVTLFLFFVSVAFIVLLGLLIKIRMNEKNEKNKLVKTNKNIMNTLAIFCTAYLVCHTLFADAIVWTGLL
jgi:ABC-type proline/glycine betaine transport system permease subunit